MKKILLSFLGLGIITTAVFALIPGLFPDTPIFPRVPIADGTIGKVFTKILGTNDLANYSGDGTVPDSLALSGISASGYLKNDINCPGTQKYTGIDADGKRICGVASTLLTDYGRIRSQDCPADYYRIDDTQGTTSSGDMLKSGDIVKTPPGCTLTIVFDDFSLIRLDGDTTISLDLGSLPDGSTIASAIIANGSVWGRILTETGSYNVGTDVIVVGVRGTSVAITSTGNSITVTNTGSGWGITRIPTTNQTLVDLVDSRLASGATINCVNRITRINMSLGAIRPGESYAINPLGCDPILPAIVWLPKSDTYTTKDWIRSNTKKDIDYIYRIQSLSGNTLPLPKITILDEELAATIPPFTVSGTLTSTGIIEASTICESGERWWGMREGCLESPILAYADFTRPIPNVAGVAPLVFYGNPPSPVISTLAPGMFVPDPGKGVFVTATGYITYPATLLTANLGGSFAGKNIILETEPVAPGIKVLIDFGSSKYAQTTGCFIPGGTCSVIDLSSGSRTKWKIVISSGIPTDFKVGGNGITSGIGARIKKFYIY